MKEQASPIIMKNQGSKKQGKEDFPADRLPGMGIGALLEQGVCHNADSNLLRLRTGHLRPLRLS